MRIVTTTSVLALDCPIDKAIIRLAALGYEGIDVEMGAKVDSDRMRPLMSDQWRDYAKYLRETAEKAGVICSHSHLPGELSFPFELHEKMLRALSEMGVKYSVVHPIWEHEDGRIIMSDDEFFSINVPLYKRIAEVGEKYGIIMLTENLMWGPTIYPKNMSRLVEEVDSPFFGWCFDTGHANVFDVTSASLRGLKHIPLSLHIQDNHGGKPGDKEREKASYGTDEHLIPYDGNIDWDEFAEVLSEIGYKGDFVLEAHHQSLEAPDEKRDEILTRLLQTAKKIENKIKL